ncbi:hypothetical protein GQ53DRAFT_438804 [Thozetella sp. PMI_491]|nr:hypothetical protein GQ53DRAFT_438804 [Thozetella sp. PMI_491]
MGRIAFLNEEMMKFENFDKYHMQNLTPYQKRLPGEAAVPEKWDALMELVIKELGIYAPMLLRLRDLQALPRVDYDEHTGLIQDIMGSDSKTSDETPMLGKELCSLYDWPDDFVSTRNERVHTAFAGLLRQHWFKRLIVCPRQSWQAIPSTKPI